MPHNASREHDETLWSDVALIAAHREGHPRALNVLLRRHQARIRRVCERMAEDVEAARDLVQETMLGIVRNLDGYRGDAAFMTWAFAVARSFAHRQRRRSRAAVRVDQAVRATHVSQDEPDCPDRALERLRLHTHLESALSALSSVDRAVLLARDFEGLTAPETAARLELTISAVKSRLHRARSQVRRTLLRELSPAAATLPRFG